jgi:hypothetical protein
MAADVMASEREFLAWCLQQSPVPRRKLATCCPNFLIISPPKTGSTWLADNLRCHPELFVATIKEVKYFSSYCEDFGQDWYLEHFAAAGGRLKGEASPSYALLPPARIRRLRRLLPGVKLVFLMRDPLARAWSHSKHVFRYRELNFASGPREFAAVAEATWQATIAQDWILASGDYLGQLQRWLAVFHTRSFTSAFTSRSPNGPRPCCATSSSSWASRRTWTSPPFPCASASWPGSRPNRRPR